MRFLALLALAGLAIAIPTPSADPTPYLSPPSNPHPSHSAPCTPTPVGTFTAPRIYNTFVSESPYLVERTTLVTWTQVSLCTAAE
ncbi:hypothetical protein BD626DRAFT_514967 [Schizophyllum amplum]|uniref:Uncharacterized protein n=1 Tax=Schizophyllum amplum TaxID=97359 RepID=A0A550BYA3_9AGAR|nr:hypothetical protein BD626DRAFT_514967 [Auriculariopsis ampla]